MNEFPNVLWSFKKYAMRMLVEICAAALIAAAPSRAASSATEVIDTRCKLLIQQWVIELQIDGGKKGWFLISTNQDKSVISPKWLGRPEAVDTAEKHEFRLEGLSLGKPEAILLEIPGPSTSEPPLAGIVGLDVLSGVALGLDMLTGEARCWKGGRVTKADVEQWLKPSPATTGSVAIPLVPESGPYVGVQASVGGKPVKLRLCISDTAGFLAKDIARKAPSEGLGKFLVPGAAMADLHLTAAFVSSGLPNWFIYHSDPSFYTDGNAEPPAGSISTLDLPASRFLLDMPAKQLILPKLSPDAMLSHTAYRLLQTPVTIQGDVMRIGPLGLDSVSTGLRTHGFDGDEVETVAGRPARDLIQALRESAEAKHFADWAALLAKDVTIQIRHAGGLVPVTIKRDWQ